MYALEFPNLNAYRNYFGFGEILVDIITMEDTTVVYLITILITI